MRKSILMMLLAVVCNSAIAEWDKIYTSNDAIRTNYVDRNSIQKKGHIVNMWSLVDFKKVQRLEESSSPMFYKSIAKRFDYDCEKKQYRVTAYDYYSDRLGDGEIVIGDSHLDASEWEKVEPLTTEEDLWKIACSKK
jgi:hypothetical protein